MRPFLRLRPAHRIFSGAIDLALFRSFWHGERLPRHVVLSIKSFVEQGHDYRLYSYGSFELPAGARLEDARDILPADRVFFYKNPDGSNGSVSAFSNVFRYELLSRYGGWWVDTDVICLSPSAPETELYLGWESEAWICSAIIRAPAGHALIQRALAESAAAGTNFGWGQIGPKLVTRLIKELGLEDCVAPRDFAYPTTFPEYEMPVRAQDAEAVRQRVHGKPFLHLWHEMFRRSNDGSIDRPEDGSYLDSAYRKHGV